MKQAEHMSAFCSLHAEWRPPKHTNVQLVHQCSACGLGVPAVAELTQPGTDL